MMAGLAMIKQHRKKRENRQDERKEEFGEWSYERQLSLLTRWLEVPT